DDPITTVHHDRTANNLSSSLYLVHLQPLAQQLDRWHLGPFRPDPSFRSIRPIQPVVWILELSLSIRRVLGYRLNTISPMRLALLNKLRSNNCYYLYININYHLQENSPDLSSLESNKNKKKQETHYDARALPRYKEWHTAAVVEVPHTIDVYHVDCGAKHAALVTKNGKVFTWGEESGGHLGHGSREDSVHPRLVESLAICNVDIVACGEFHTCAVTTSGELYTWGDGTYNIGLLGNGTDVSHWIPKRISRVLEGHQVAYVSCGTWHTALVTGGQLFMFGDGTFGVLGHENRESFSCPREVESLSGLKTIAVACGVWHTAAAIEVIVTQSSSSMSPGKLFTWGDGDKHRLGHGDKEPKLKPTCVDSLIDYDFCRIACGHSLTVGLTTSGQVLSMGNTVYGRLGNPRLDGKLPCLIEDIMGEHVVQVACGSYHVAVLTNKSEVFTWGKGASGRLGHGDVEDRKLATLVESLRDRVRAPRGGGEIDQRFQKLPLFAIIKPSPDKRPTFDNKSILTHKNSNSIIFKIHK
ncbi:hypothetical protein ACJX0J_041791, partial [Zea mays]